MHQALRPECEHCVWGVFRARAVHGAGTLHGLHHERAFLRPFASALGFSLTGPHVQHPAHTIHTTQPWVSVRDHPGQHMHMLTEVSTLALRSLVLCRSHRLFRHSSGSSSGTARYTRVHSARVGHAEEKCDDADAVMLMQLLMTTVSLCMSGPRQGWSFTPPLVSHPPTHQEGISCACVNTTCVNNTLLLYYAGSWPRTLACSVPCCCSNMLCCRDRYPYPSPSCPLLIIQLAPAAVP